VKKYATRCRMELRRERRVDNGAVEAGLQKRKYTNMRSDIAPIKTKEAFRTTIRYEAWRYHRPLLQHARSRSRWNRYKIERSRGQFSQLAHYIGRLGATRSSVDKVVKAMTIVPALRKISTIRIVDTSEPKDITVFPDFVSPYEIVWDICKDSAPQNPNEIKTPFTPSLSLTSS
jgi:hypothetical protein